MSQLVELCAGTAAVSLAALGERPVPPLTGYMGSKRRWARLLCHVLGLDRAPDEVLLVDAGPWGQAWTTLQNRAGRINVAKRLLAWSKQGDPHALWMALSMLPPFVDPAERAAQFLWLQARSAGCIPVWWDGARWAAPSGGRIQVAGQRGSEKGSRRIAGACETGRDGSRRANQKGAGSRLVASAHMKRNGPRKVRGIQSPATIASRIQALDALDWGRVRVSHGLIENVAPDPSAETKVYFDPPYQGAPRYAETCVRENVLRIAQLWDQAGAHVVISEGGPLPIAGWGARELPQSNGREWVTSNRSLAAIPQQIAMQWRVA